MGGTYSSHGGCGKCIVWGVYPLLDNDSVNTFPQEPTRAKIGRLSLGNGSGNTPKTIRDNRRRCFAWGPPQGYITGSSKGTAVFTSRILATDL
jgi:hypothetical protein